METLDCKLITKQIGEAEYCLKRMRDNLEHCDTATLTAYTQAVDRYMKCIRGAVDKWLELRRR